jgi:hypothetical protein
MRGILAYLAYVVRHKWFVTIECWKDGLLWRGLRHDLSKFLPSEFFPYARFFYEPDGSKRTKRDKTGYYKPSDTGDPSFDKAWFLHQKRNDHHWQWWVFPDDGPGVEHGGEWAIEGGWKSPPELLYKVKVFPMSDKARREMQCDWIGAGRSQGTPSTKDWYEKNREKLVLHPDTRKAVEQWLDERFPKD